MEDEIVKEIHETRRRILKECGGDIDRLIERLKAAESKDKDRLVSVEDVQRRASTRKATI